MRIRRPFIYIVSWGVLCALAGAAAGIIINKRYTFNNLPRIIREYLLKYPQNYGRLKKALVFPARRNLTRETRGAFIKLSRELGLSAEQKKKLKKVLGEVKEKIDRTRFQFRTSLSQIKDEAITQIASFLNPEQKRKFEELVEKLKKERKGKRQDFSYPRRRKAFRRRKFDKGEKGL